MHRIAPLLLTFSRRETSPLQIHQIKDQQGVDSFWTDLSVFSHLAAVASIQIIFSLNHFMNIFYLYVLSFHKCILISISQYTEKKIFRLAKNYNFHQSKWNYFASQIVIFRHTKKMVIDHRKRFFQLFQLHPKIEIVKKMSKRLRKWLKIKYDFRDPIKNGLYLSEINLAPVMMIQSIAHKATCDYDATSNTHKCLITPNRNKKNTFET